MAQALKWVLGVMLAIVLAIGAMFAAGEATPAGHVATVLATFHQPPEAVWAAITDHEHAPAWREVLQRVERLPDHEGHPAWKEVTDFGPMPFAVVEASAPHRYVTRILEEEGFLSFGGSWTYILQEVPQGCRLTITENGVIHDPIFRFFSHYVFGYHATMERYLRDLGTRFGEDVETEHGG